jgi:hypothetical protein
MGRIGRRAGALAVAVVVGAAVCAAGGASAAIIKTKISLAELKEVYNLSSIRRLIDPEPRDGVSFYMTGPGKRGTSIGKDGKKPDLSKSFVFFKVNTKRASDPVLSIGWADVQFNHSERRKKPGSPIVRVSCTLRGSTSAGIRSVTCGGRSVSPT